MDLLLQFGEPHPCKNAFGRGFTCVLNEHILSTMTNWSSISTNYYGPTICWSNSATVLLHILQYLKHYTVSDCGTNAIHYYWYWYQWPIEYWIIIVYYCCQLYIAALFWLFIIIVIIIIVITVNSYTCTDNTLHIIVITIIVNILHSIY